MVEKTLTCKMILDINGKEAVCHFVTTKKMLKTDADIALKHDLYRVLN